MSVRRLVARAAFLAAFLAAGAAHALDHTIPAVKLRLRLLPSGKEQLLLFSKNPLLPIGAVGSPDDPSLAGAHIELFSPNGPAHTLFDVPAGLGNPGWKLEPTAQLYMFRNGLAPGGPSLIKLLVLQNGKKVKILGKSTGLTLGTLGAVGLRITAGSYRNCVLFDATRSTLVKDTADEFLGRDAVASPALPDCGAHSLGGATCGNGAVETDETCDGSDDAACPGLCNANCTCPPPVCGDQHVNQASEECDGTDDGACPGNCQPSCVCLGVCGDGIVNQPSEGCDGAGSCIQPGLLDCRPPGVPGECTCCSVGGFSCDVLGCCDPERTCIPGPHSSGSCCFNAAGHTCQGDSDCCFGRVCSGGVCCGSAGSSCGSGVECCSGSCSGSACDP